MPLPVTSPQRQAEPVTRHLGQVVVVASHLQRRTIPAGEVVAGYRRHPVGEDLALDLSRQLHLALEALLLQRLAASRAFSRAIAAWLANKARVSR